MQEFRPIVEMDPGLEMAPVPDAVADLTPGADEPPPREGLENEEADGARGERRRRRSRRKSSLRAARREGQERAQRSSRRVLGHAVGWAVFVAMLGGLAGSGIVYRQQIIDYLPPDAKHQAADVYDWLGLPFSLPGYGLKIEVTQSSRDEAEQESVLVIEGKITNISAKARELPQLRAALRDSDNRELQHWFVRLNGDQLLSGQTASFRTTIDNPAEEARNLHITFARSD